MTAMIDIQRRKDLHWVHLQGGVELSVVRGASFHVAPGECVVLSGLLAPANPRSQVDFRQLPLRWRPDRYPPSGDGDRSRQRRAAAGACCAARPSAIANSCAPCRGRLPLMVAEPPIVIGTARAEAPRKGRHAAAPGLWVLEVGAAATDAFRRRNSSASTSRAGSFPICRSRCWTSRRCRWTPPIATVVELIGSEEAQGRRDGGDRPRRRNPASDCRPRRRRDFVCRCGMKEEILR